MTETIGKTKLTFTVNGRETEVLVDPSWTLLRVLRESLGLTGTKRGCEEGDCGLCTVIMEDRAVDSCLVMALQAQGKTVETIEGMGHEHALHPLQKAFIEEGAVQCGFCTPGMIMSSEALLRQNTHPTVEEIKVGLSGNLCRCTGYTKIFKAVAKGSESGGRL
ncbi:2Fe-2S iron-sulfur cluster-binding protein [Desulfobacula sp.]|uniref:(2Fe-2S)-binding protein n=1 Tax=Desulfobacula sp. TaxID=2593537 RepID=UPI002618768C|nr:2Fe-2S iron-sulfur cluster-binding protein [Desulfobacula sp.]